MFDRLCGAEIHLFTPEEFVKKGGYDVLLNEFANRLRREGKNPYIIPLGGSKYFLFNNPIDGEFNF
jgi:1-aminocyclopropane-1-carboxylate deaminase/D-cysteine desulfhydrase-like pyridoxal-dependent ACC family enzyme